MAARRELLPKRHLPSAFRASNILLHCLRWIEQSEKRPMKRFCAALAIGAVTMSTATRRRLAFTPRANGEHLCCRGHRRRPHPSGGRPSLRRLQAAVLRRDARRRRRLDRRAVGRQFPARRIRFRSHQHHAPGAAADQQSQARLRPAPRSHQHRLCRRCSDHDLGQRGKRRAHIQRFHRTRQKSREPVDLFFIRRRQLGSSGRGVVCAKGQDQGRARAL